MKTNFIFRYGRCFFFFLFGFYELLDLQSGDNIGSNQRLCPMRGRTREVHLHHLPEVAHLQRDKIWSSCDPLIYVTQVAHTHTQTKRTDKLWYQTAISWELTLCMFIIVFLYWEKQIWILSTICWKLKLNFCVRLCINHPLVLELNLRIVVKWKSSWVTYCICSLLTL